MKYWLRGAELTSGQNLANANLGSENYLGQLNNMSQNKISHIIEGSKSSNHGWENLVPYKNWNDIKN